MSQPGTILGGALFTAVAAGAGTSAAALWVGAVGTALSGLLMLATKTPTKALLEDHPHDVA